MSYSRGAVEWSGHELGCDLEGQVYVARCVATDGHEAVKVGMTWRSAYDRLSILSREAKRKHNLEIVAAWASPGHMDPDVQERTLLQWCWRNGAEILPPRSTEWFTGLPWGDVVAFAETLPFVAHESTLPTPEMGGLPHYCGQRGADYLLAALGQCLAPSLASKSA